MRFSAENYDETAFIISSELNLTKNKIHQAFENLWNIQISKVSKIKKHNFLECELIIDGLYLFFKIVKMTFNNGAYFKKQY